jgi:predicted RNA-binding protein (virulence factor B family)
MIEQGKEIELKISKRSSFGLFLIDESGEEVLLPNKYCSEKMKPGESLKVFVYKDSEGRRVATTLIPKIYLHEFALLKVTAVTDVGAFMDWGLEKELMVPFREQKQKMEAGRWYIVYLDLDKKTDRLYASNRIERFLQNDQISLKEGEEVVVVVQQKTDLGYSVIINHTHKGLIYDNQIFKEIRIGDKLRGYVKNVRNDQKIDISLQPLGFRNVKDSNSQLILNKLEENGGFLAITDKSSPVEIYSQFRISKKAFKNSLGTLYKNRIIDIRPDGIKLL